MTHTRIVPLGGLGEVGMNCLAIETPGGILVVDCGVTFPHGEPGVNVIHPEFGYLWERREEVLGVVVTHGHEDHIGALPYLLRRIPVPVWAPPYAATLIRGRLAEHADVPAVDLRITVPRQRFAVGEFTIEPLRVTHSIPDSTALCIETRAGRILHTGDFKLESEPLDGQVSDETRLRELGEDGISVLMSDSTNVDVPGRAARERDVGATLRGIIATQPGRVVVGVFASNIFRLKTIFQAARETDRRVVLLGRSVQTHVRAAIDLGLLRGADAVLVPADSAMSLPARDVLAIAGGTQAEPNSAISRLSRGDHPKLKLERGDTVIFSSRAIPGNERAVFDLVCALERRGHTVVFRPTEGEIHASGHAGREEQSRMLEWTRPRSFIPIHGTYHHLRRHAELATEHGVRDVMLIENGDTVALGGSTLARGEGVRHGRVYVDEGIELSEETMGERSSLAGSGVVLATALVDVRGRLQNPVQITTRGVIFEDDPEVVAVAAEVAIEEAIRIARGALDRITPESVRDAVRSALRRVYRVGNKRPNVVVHVTQLLDEPG